jgi:NAD(P)-dependent dehydrogenase (short-subunit alcohol dehydrogenase family)
MQNISSQQRSGRIVNVSSVLGFLPAPYMGLYAASKHAVEGLSETLDHEVRPFGIRVALVEPSFTKTRLDLNAPQALARIPDYAQELGIVSRAIQRNIQKAPAPDGVAATLVEAALGPWKMRHTPRGEASLLARLRRFMPASPVEKGLRKSFGLG